MFRGLRQLLLKAGWAPVAVLFAHNGIARIFGHNPSLDPAMHLLGGAAMAYFFYQALMIGSRWFGKPRLRARFFIAFCFATTVAVFWEFIEFAGGLATGISAQHSLAETMEDLLLGCSGAFILLLFVTLRQWIINRRSCSL